MDTISIPPQADSASIKTHLERLIRRWHEIGADEWLSLEIRLLARGSSPVVLKYKPDPDGIQMAVEDICHWNAKRRNAYACVNPLKENVGGPASDDAIGAAFCVFADCDDQASGNALKALAGPKYTHVIMTGTVPYPRAHGYWELAEPQTDMDAWSDMQRRIAAALGSDRAVVNPSRIMRIAGTVTWPDQKKQDRGYLSEVATFINKGGLPVEWSSLDRAYAQATPQAAHTPLSALASIDTGPKPLDRQTVATSALSGEEWHNNLIRLVASYVSKGLTDPEIHAITDSMTLPGYTVEQTRQEVQTAINGARAKGFAPAPHAAAIPPEEPQPLVREIPPGEPYPVEHLGPLQGAVEAVRGMTQAPVAIPAQSALAVASLAVQGFANVETLGGVRPVSLYALTIARSGERKSACDAPLLAGLRDFEMEQAKAQRADLESWRNAHALWKGERDRILGDAKRGKGEKRVAAQADLEALGVEPKAPPSTDRTVTEPTFEGLTKLFAHGQPSLGLFSDEGAQFLGGHAMSKDHRQKTLGAFNDLWAGNAIRRARAGDGHTTLYGRRLAVHLMVQPTVAYTFMADPLAADIGFLPRVLLCEPPSTIGTRLQANTCRDDAALEAFAERLRGILETPMPMDPETRELKPRTLSLAPDAKALLAQFAVPVEKQQAPGGDLAHVTGTASKAAEQAARIAGVLTLWRDLHAPVVTALDMADGIALAQYYLTEAARLASAATVSAEIDRAESLRKWLLENWQHPEIMVREVVRFGPNPLRESPKAKAALGLLEKHGWLVKLPPGTMVRDSARAESWRIVKGGGHVV